MFINMSTQMKPYKIDVLLAPFDFREDVVLDKAKSGEKGHMVQIVDLHHSSFHRR